MTRNAENQTKNRPFSKDPKEKMEFFDVIVHHFDYLVLHFIVVVY